MARLGRARAFPPHIQKKNIWIRLVSTTAHTTDALLKGALTKTHTTDADLKGAGTKTHTTDALLKATQNKTHTTDADLKGAVTKTHTTDSYLLSLYSREANVVLPSTDATLATQYTSSNKDDVATSDDVRVRITGAGYLIHQFKVKNVNNTDSIIVDCECQTIVAPSSKNVFLQIYNRTSTTWETLDTDNSSAATTDFALSGTQSTSLSDYYDASNIVSFRVYQDA